MKSLPHHSPEVQLLLTWLGDHWLLTLFTVAFWVILLLRAARPRVVVRTDYERFLRGERDAYTARFELYD